MNSKNNGVDEMNLPYVSIIIVNYNGKQFIEKCVSSILSIDYPSTKYEVIVVDNNSVDGSIELIENKFRGIQIVRLKRNLGYVGGVNTGEKYAKGAYVVVLNNDLIVEKKWLIELIRPMIINSNVGICTSKTLLMDNPSIIDGVGSTNNILGQRWVL